MFQFFYLGGLCCCSVGEIKDLLEFLLVMLKGSPWIPDLDVTPVSLISDEIVPFRTPIIISVSFRWRFYFWLLCLSFNIVEINFCHHDLLFLDWRLIDRLKFTVCWCLSLVSVVMWQMCSATRSTSSTWLVIWTQQLCQCVCGKLIFILFKFIHSVTYDSIMYGTRSSYSTL